MSCKFCHKETAEDQIQCATCKELCHPSCLELPAHIVPVVKTYDWQCNDCKYCNGCHATDNEKQILFCDRCDRGYHMYCVKPPIRKKPKGDWFCPCCVAVKLSNKDGSDLSFNPESTKKVTGTKRGRPKERVSSSEDNPPQQKITKDSISATTDSSATSSKAATSEIPVEHVVSKTDIEMYEAAKKKAETLMALDKAMCPQDDSVKTIRLGDVEMEAWYQSQYPLDFSKSPKLFICEFCFDYSKTETIYKRHTAKCTFRHPPGEEIYRKDKLSVFEVDGQTATKYCQNLCLLAKLFLDHKTLWMDVGPFLFYIMTIADETGCHIIGYFSKEKVSFLNYNVSCILVMPNYMKKGYGQMLIEFSYLLSQKEGRTGSPERPLSDLGLMSYRKFWEEKLLRYLMEYSEDQISIKGLSETMSIHPSDIVSTLQFLGMLKYWKGKHLILLRKEIIEEYTTKAKTKPNNDREIDPLCLKWTPKVFK